MNKNINIYEEYMKKNITIFEEVIMNRFERRMCKLLKPYQKKEIIARIVRESDKHTEIEKMELLQKLNNMNSDEVCETFEKIIEDLKKGA